MKLESLQSKWFKILLRLVGRKRFWEMTGEELKKGIAKRRLLNHEPPKELQQRLNIEKKELNGHFYYEIHPLEKTSKKHIFYLHGGAYVHKITKYHWDFLGRLANELKCTITVPLYPLAPEHTYKQTFDFVNPLYMKQIGTIDNPNDVVLMGDSAGGGLALALAQLLSEKQIQQPGNIILISPWLDLSLENPEIDSIDKYDPFLSKSGAIEAGKMYAGETDRKHFLLSPMYGELNGLGDITLFMGTHDILVADARRFVKIAKEQGKVINYFEGPQMIHVYPIFTFPESKSALEQIVNKIK